jgi:hypothetical protein
MQRAAADAGEGRRRNAEQAAEERRALEALTRAGSDFVRRARSAGISPSKTGVPVGRLQRCDYYTEGFDQERKRMRKTRWREVDGDFWGWKWYRRAGPSENIRVTFGGEVLINGQAITRLRSADDIIAELGRFLIRHGVAAEAEA